MFNDSFLSDYLSKGDLKDGVYVRTHLQGVLISL